jgi:hypothetical protein
VRLYINIIYTNAEPQAQTAGAAQRAGAQRLPRGVRGPRPGLRAALPSAPAPAPADVVPNIRDIIIEYETPKTAHPMAHPPRTGFPAQDSIELPGRATARASPGPVCGGEVAGKAGHTQSEPLLSAPPRSP